MTIPPSPPDSDAPPPASGLIPAVTEPPSTPRIAEIREAPVEPYRFKMPKFRGGIAASHVTASARLRGAGPDGSRFRDQPGDLDPGGRRGFFGGGTALPRLSGRYLWGGPLWNHFGHVFVDCVHRLWALKANPGAYDGLVFGAVQGLEGVQTDAQLAAVTPPRVMEELLDLLGMAPIRIEMIRTPTVIERLDVPMAGTARRAPILPFYRGWLDRYQEHLQDRLALHIRRAPERLLLSRSHLLHKGGILGSSAFEAAFRRAGFLSFTPEAASLGMQLGYLMGARTIVADEGSALHPAQVLSRLEGEILMFPRRARSEVYERALGERGRYSALATPDEVIALPDRFGNLKSPGGLGAYRDPALVWRRLQDRGLIEEPFDAAAFEAAEMADLESSQPRNRKIHAQRMALLREVRD